MVSSWSKVLNRCGNEWSKTRCNNMNTQNIIWMKKQTSEWYVQYGNI